MSERVYTANSFITHITNIAGIDIVKVRYCKSEQVVVDEHPDKAEEKNNI